jgi:hypothetical protein
MTPKAASRFDEAILPDWCKQFEIVPTADIYINMMDEWTEEECDNIAYIVEKDALDRNITFRGRD